MHGLWIYVLIILSGFAHALVSSYTSSLYACRNFEYMSLLILILRGSVSSMIGITRACGRRYQIRQGRK